MVALELKLGLKLALPVRLAVAVPLADTLLERLGDREGDSVDVTEKDGTKTQEGKAPDQLPSPLQVLNVADPA